MKSIIAVTSIFVDGRDTLPRTYSHALYSADALPFILSPSDRASDAVTAAVCADALLLSGGGDIYCPNSPYAKNVDTLRDTWERLLIEAFVGQNKKILGICRGLQIIADYFGGETIGDIQSEVCHQAADDVFHNIEVLPGTLLASLLGSGEHRVNSAHHQAPANVPSKLTLSSVCKDGVIESLEFGNVLGVQWHPERMGGEHSRLFEWLVGK